MDSFIMRVAGVTFDGRQRIIANLKVGEKLYFEPQPNNPYDCYAVEIFTTNRSSVGYIPKGENQTIFRNLLDKKAQYSVTVVAITGGGSYNYGLSIKQTLVKLNLMLLLQENNMRKIFKRDYDIIIVVIKIVVMHCCEK